MEGVGARLGRSSTRYVPTTVFTGPVRKWKKKWIHVTPPNTATAAARHHRHHQASIGSNGNSSSNDNSNNGSHILLYKWTPISQSQKSAADLDSNGDAKDDGAAAEVEGEPPRRKIKYIPIALREEQKNEAPETDPNAAAEPTSNGDDVDEKPDINDVPMEKNQVSEDAHVERQNLNENALDLNARDGDEDPEETKEQTESL